MRTRFPAPILSGLALAAALVAAGPVRAQAVTETTTTTTTAPVTAPAPDVQPEPMAAPASAPVVPDRKLYVTGMYDGERADRDRRSDDQHTDSNGKGAQFGIGVPYGASGHEAFELNFYSVRRRRSLDDQRDYRKGLMIDLVHDFGSFGYTRTDGRVFGPTVKPFVFLGAGVLDDNVLGNHNYEAGGELGLGFVASLYKELGFRFQARVVGQENDQSYERAGPNGARQTALVDYDFMAGLQLPLPFYKRIGQIMPIAVTDVPPPVADTCPTRVVDPSTGSSECVGDADSDGVVDSLDQCPDTPAGTVVNAEGCPALEPAPSPEVPPATEPVTTTTTTTTETPAVEPPLPPPPAEPAAPLAPLATLPPIHFETNSTAIDGSSRETLDRIAAGLKANPDTRLQIAGHADKVGGETYNLMLGGLRAEAARQYLLDHGVDGARVTVVSYGDFDVASKDVSSTRSVSFRYFGK